MTTNLWDIYKAFSQRSHRNPVNDLLLEMKTIAHEIVTNKLTRDEIWCRANKLLELEIELAPREYFSKRIINALEINQYEINIPYQVRHKYEFQELIGYIYIFTSKSKLNQSKIGATTMQPEIRAAKYTSKYFYKVNVFYYKDLKDPFGFEDKIKKLIFDKRVHGNIENDSIEWYFIEPDELKKIIEGNLVN